jgi:ribonuclease BN (tRNA processing enzyme)
MAEVIELGEHRRAPPRRAGGRMGIVLLGTGGMAPTGERETACTLVRDDRRALLLDCGTGARRLLTDRSLLSGLSEIDVVLTHFHLDHICGLTYLSSLPVAATIWAPGTWLYGADSAELLRPLRVPPISPTDTTGRVEVRELTEGGQVIAGFDVHASAQPRHWGPSAGLRVDDALALVTDTPYEPTSATLARGVQHLLHEAWSSSAEPLYADRDATAADAARVASEADVGQLTLVHLNPAMPDPAPLLADAQTIFERARLGEDNMVLEST